MDNKMNTNEQISRMKALMGYGLQTESKAPYSSVENQKLGADGKMYGIVREGKNYFIKVAPNKENLVKENFDYIGGFRNRKDYQYDSFADAQKNFDMKMMSLREAANKRDYSVTSWDLEKKENVVIEATDKMRNEINRSRQIMENAMKIAEGKKECANGICDKDIKNSQKDNISSSVEECGDAASANAGYTNAEVPASMTEGVVSEEEVLGWNRGNDDYMDKSHGTEIGDSAPFDGPEARNIDDGDKKVTNTGEMKNGTVEEGASMHDSDNQNTPTPGVGEIGDNQPFDGEKGKQIDEAFDDFGGEDVDGAPALEEGEGEGELGDDLGAEGEGEPMGDELGDDLGAEGEEDFATDGEGDDVYEDDVESRLDAMEELLSQIADKLGIGAPSVDASEYSDDDIFGDEGDDFGDEEPIEDEPIDDEMPMESRRRNGVQIYETKAFKAAMRKQRVNEGEDDDERRNLISKEIGKILRSKDAGKASRAKRNGRRLDDLSTEELRNLDNEGYMRRNGGLVNEEGMTPFTDNGRVPSGNMNKLDDFGKHPAYQKVVMDLPPKDMKEFPEYYDMNDDSVKNDTPYGEKIGDGAPFDIDPQAIDNAIAEAFNRLKKNRK